MTRSEITQKVKEVIALNSHYKLSDIGVDDPLDKFISSFEKDRLARELKRKLDKIITTALTNLLYETIKIIKQLVDHIDKIYNPPA